MSVAVATTRAPRTPVLFALVITAGFAWVAARSDPMAGFWWIVGGAVVAIGVAYGIAAASRLAWVVGVGAAAAVLLKGIDRLVEGYQMWRLALRIPLPPAFAPEGYPNEVLTDPLFPIGVALLAFLLLLWPSTRRWVRHGKSNLFEASTVIEAPAETVWHYATDPALAPRWDPNIVEWESLEGSGQPAVGNRVRYVMQINGRRLVAETKTTGLEEGRYVAATADLPGGSLTGAFRLRGSGTGVTITHSITYDLTVFRRAWLVLARGSILKIQRQRLDLLRRAVEEDMAAAKAPADA